MDEMYLIRYWTKDGQRTGIQIMANNALDAKMIAEQLPNFGTLMTSPEKVK